MGVTAVSTRKYGGLLAKVLPKVIENDKELEHFAGILEQGADVSDGAARTEASRPSIGVRFA